jgi:hypothetical protein
MRKINIDPYDVVVDEKGTKLPFEVKGSIINSLYHPDLRLSAKELLDNDRLAQKIKDCWHVALLEEAEYERVKHAFEVIRGWELNDVEMVKRVLEAEPVEVAEK